MLHCKKQLKLSTLLITPGSSGGGWRDQTAQPERILDFAFYRELARTAEEGKLDYIFQPDKYTISANSPEELRRGINIWPEPVTLLSALAGATSHIGLSATISTTYHEPFHVARMLATLDHLSGGRASWNVVTSIGDLDAHNFRNDHRPLHEQRHAHSGEFLDVVKALWDSWEDDAIKIDRETGDFADPAKIHTLHHEGAWFSVRGPLNVARPIQGHPVIIQAGRSDTFRERAAQQADVVFTALRTLPEAQAFYFDLKRRLAKYGRATSDLLLMPGLNVVVGATEAEAKEKREHQERLLLPEARKDIVSSSLGLDISGYSLDDPLPEPDLADAGMASYRQWKQTADQLGLVTIRQLYEHVRQQSGHFSITGTPAQIADRLEEWLTNDAADGFTFIPHLLPQSLHDLVHFVIPELQNRGIFRTEYSGSTLREHLGVPRPSNRFVVG
ncbi:MULTISPECIES: LLM class flavin-dependent oxidoreductase [Brevibacillus]|uniref:LLM class flavin-dependent oxidoreductase n=1 Tax=Brevibacillus TaxID=55080 RepID=UPI000ECF9797|nr:MULTISPECIES: LLM class flavin-dependent oxidoreductase [Brevibacillus]HBZ82284.1 nitrilotriacetate monooxygenase [Brevibacillus sp.]